MPFDANLVLLDGSLDLDSAIAPSGTADLFPETDADGASVIDLKKTGAKGLSVVLIVPAMALDADYITPKIESNDDVDFPVATSAIEAVFQGALGNEQIFGSEVPAVFIKRITVSRRYIRLTCGVSGTPGKVQCLISPYPFNVL